jgi:hypothetical protein
LFVDPGEHTVLTCLQSDILNLRDRGKDDVEKKVISAGDASVQVHSCHSPLRELEVLYDHLLDWFDHDPQLAPRAMASCLAPMALGRFWARSWVANCGNRVRPRLMIFGVLWLFSIMLALLSLGRICSQTMLKA